MLLVGWVIGWGAGQSPETEVYRLAPGDLITITVLGEPQLS